MAEPPDVFPHGDVAVPVGTHVVLVETVVGEEGPDRDVVGGVEAHVHNPGHDAVVWPHGAGHGRERAEEHGEVALVGIVRGVDRGRCILGAVTGEIQKYRVSRQDATPEMELLSVRPVRPIRPVIPFPA